MVHMGAHKRQDVCAWMHTQPAVSKAEEDKDGWGIAAAASHLDEQDKTTNSGERPCA